MPRRLHTLVPRPALIALTLLAVLSATIAHAATAGGGLSVVPAIVEPDKPPATGLIGSIVVANSTTTTQNITITPRPWIAAPNGLVKPDLKHDLSALIEVSRPTFTLVAGASQSVNLKLRKPAPGGSLYAAIVTVGVPVDAAKRSGISVGYRLISRLRLDPSAADRKLKVVVGAPRIQGRYIVLPVRNTGNTIEPINGFATLKSPLGTRNAAINAQRILPGATETMIITALKGLKPGKYAVSYQLIQNGPQVAHGTHTVVVK
jgi:hypothetical protein